MTRMETWSSMWRQWTRVLSNLIIPTASLPIKPTSNPRTTKTNHRLTISKINNYNPNNNIIRIWIWTRFRSNKQHKLSLKGKVDLSMRTLKLSSNSISNCNSNLISITSLATSRITTPCLTSQNWTWQQFRTSISKLQVMSPVRRRTRQLQTWWWME